LASGDLLLQRLDIAPDAAIRDRKLAHPLIQAPGQLDRAKLRVGLELVNQEVSMCVQPLSPGRVFLSRTDGRLVHPQILAHRVAGNAQLTADGPSGEPSAVVV